MWRLIVSIALVCTGLSTGIEDLSQVICKNATAGDIIPNPRDCSSYFICDQVPLIRFCDDGLHFDVKYKVCNWPALAKCPVIQEQPKLAFVATASKTEPNGPKLSFTALDVHTYSEIDTMAYYDPKNVGCRHYGIYFLPSPNDCSAYYICAFGHMLQHQCGRATGWNYKRQVCDIRPFAECFNGITFPQSATQMSTEAASTTELLYGQSTGMPADNSKYTVRYILNNGIAGPLIWMPQSVADTTASSTFTDQHLTFAAVASTGRAKPEVNEIPNCPKGVDAYFPHGKDCTKYYICKIGMPVLTSCPKGLYWNQRAEVCDLPTKVDCPQKKS